MQYLNSEKITKEFIERTLANLKAQQYPFEVTQFLNSLFGLLIIPKEQLYDSITNNWIDKSLLREVQKNISIGRQSQSLKNIINHMRNACSHSHIEIKAEQPITAKDPPQISSIIFCDKEPHAKDYNFEMELNVDLLKDFVLAFANKVLEKAS